MNLHVQLGYHLLADLWGCHVELLRDLDRIREYILEACRSVKFNVLDKEVEHKFDGEGGVSLTILLQESHIFIHTWPEHCYAAIDIFTCDLTKDPRQVYDKLMERFQPADTSVYCLKRGIGFKTIEGSSW